MKKIITLILVLVMMLAFVGCQYLPEDFQATINGIIGGEDHTAHNFVEYDSKDATCTEDGYVKSKCACGETFTTRSTKSELRVDICSKCHPFFTGKQKFVDAGGRVDKFKKKFNLE